MIGADRARFRPEISTMITVQREVKVRRAFTIREDDLDQPAIRRAIKNGRLVSSDARQESPFLQ
jgi:hypothetical protein